MVRVANLGPLAQNQPAHSMLYARWKEVVRSQGDRWALRAGRQEWTFAELDRAAEAVTIGGQSILYPLGLDCIRSALVGWRTGTLVCPLEAGQPRPQLPRPPAQVVHLKSTSATTGRPRWVCFTADQLQADVDHIVATMGLRPDSPNLGAISLVHSYGFSNLVLPLLLHGVPLVMLESSLPEEFKRTLAWHEQWTVPAVPALWRVWHEAGLLNERIRLAISAGAPLSLELERAVFDRCGLKLHNFYGATECGGIAYDRSTRPREEARDVGTALTEVELTVGPEGCLEVRSAAVGQGYWPEPDAALADGCYRTADLAEVNHGQLRLLGRATDQINVAGRKVFPDQIETNLRRHPRVRDCLVFGIPNPQGDRTESIVACVVASSVDAQELRRHLSRELPAWQLPRHWWFVPALETTQRGKLSRTEYRRRFLETQTNRKSREEK